MHEVLGLLSRSLEPETRYALTHRVDALMRGIRFEATRDSAQYHLVRRRGWEMEHLEILCCLNAFYQIVLGPLSSVSRPGLRTGLVTDHPIAYGKTLTITREATMKIRECHDVFVRITRALSVNFWWLQANHAQDLLYRLAEVEDSE